VSWRRAPRITVDTARAWYQAATYLAAAWMPRAASRSPRTGSPHMVLLARHLPPAINGGVYRPLALLNAASRRGWQVTAFSQPPVNSPTPAGLELRNRFPPEVRLISWQWSTLDVSHRLTPNLDGGFTTIGSIIETAHTVFGDSTPSLVLATGPTFAEFVGAMALARHWGVPFVLDYRDEWSESPFVFVHHGSSDRFWEARVIERAALVTFTTEAQREHQLRAFPGLRRERTAVVANGWDERASEAGNPEQARPSSDRAVIGYLGSLGQHCDLPEFLATLRVALAGNPALASRIEFDFIGLKTETERRLLHAFETPGVLKDLQQVPLSEAQGAMRGCDALLLFNPPLLARYIPGKTYEYIAAGSRILLYGEGGELEPLLTTYPAALRVRRGDARGLAEALETIASRVGESRADPVLVDHYSRGRRASEHMDLLERVIEDARENGAASPPPS